MRISPAFSSFPWKRVVAEFIWRFSAVLIWRLANRIIILRQAIFFSFS